LECVLFLEVILEEDAGLLLEKGALDVQENINNYETLGSFRRHNNVT
jgi:hypothetical protein